MVDKFTGKLEKLALIVPDKENDRRCARSSGASLCSRAWSNLCRRNSQCFLATERLCAANEATLKMKKASQAVTGKKGGG